MTYADDLARLAGTAAAGASTPAPPYVMLSDLVGQPELLEPPVFVVPHVAWEGRVSLLAAEEKAGKSTLTGQAAATLVTAGTFLGIPLELRPVLWLALDEPLGDLVRRFVRFGARRGVAVVQERPSLPGLRRLIEEVGPGLVVVDTLAEYAAGDVEDLNDAGQWLAPLRGLRQVAQETGAGILLLHHTNRSSGRYRGSSQIGAGVDAILEMTADPTDPAVRVIRSRGRILNETLRLRYSELEGYRLEGAEVSLETRVLGAIGSHPGKGVKYLRKVVGGKAGDVDAILERLERAGAIRNAGTDRGKAYHLAGVPIGRDTSRDTLPEQPAKSLRTPPGHPGDTSRDTGGVSRPLGTGAGHPPDPLPERVTVRPLVASRNDADGLAVADRLRQELGARPAVAPAQPLRLILGPS